MTWEKSVCVNTVRANFADVNSLVVCNNASKESPIDSFYSSTSEILTKITPDYFQSHGGNITGLLLIGLISATENYFRDALGFILKICPTSQAFAAGEKIQLGSLLWSKNDMHNRSAFEFTSFSSGANIKKAITNFVDYKIKQSGTLEAMLNEYDKLCELRHAIVHSGHIVAGKNAIKLGLKRNKSELRVSMTYANIQEAGQICTSLVISANNELFEEMVRRWAVCWRKLPSWDPVGEEALLETIRKSFLSTRDKKNKTIPNFRTKKGLLHHVRNAFSL